MSTTAPTSPTDATAEGVATCVDIVIVGAGLVGRVLALALVQQSDLSVLLLDADGRLPDFQHDRLDRRVVALSPASEALLTRLHVWPRMAARRVCPYRAMDVWDAEGNGRIQFDCRDLHRADLGHIVEQSVMLGALHETQAALPAEARLSYWAPVRVVEWQRSTVAQVLCLDDGRRVHAGLVIGADGAQSQLRELAGVATREWDYGHSAIVTSVRTERPHKHTAYQAFSHSGPLAFLPLIHGDGREEGHYCSIVWSLDTPMAEAMMAAEPDVFAERLAQALEQRLGRVTWVDQRQCLPLRQRRALAYGHPGFALVGDAAHTLHPLAGQGVNLGLYDADALSAEILRARRRSLPLYHPSIVQRYQQRRQVHNLAAMAAMEGFKRLFGAEDPLLRVLRNRGMGWVNRAHALKRHFMTLAAGGL